MGARLCRRLSGLIQKEEDMRHSTHKPAKKPPPRLAYSRLLVRLSFDPLYEHIPGITNVYGKMNVTVGSTGLEENQIAEALDTVRRGVVNALTMIQPGERLVGLPDGLHGISLAALRIESDEEYAARMLGYNDREASKAIDRAATIDERLAAHETAIQRLKEEKAAWEARHGKPPLETDQ